MSKKIFFIIQAVFLIAALIYLVTEASSRFELFDAVETRTVLLAVVSGLGPTFVGLMFLFLVWKRNFDDSLRGALAQSLSIFFVGQLGKYIPAPMMSTVGHGVMSKSLTTARVGVHASLMVTGFAVISALTLSVFLTGPASSTWWFPLLGLAILGNAFAVSKLPSVILHKLLRLDGHVGSQGTRLSRLVNLMFSYLVWVFFGLGTFLAAIALDLNSSPSLIQSIIGYAAAHSAGILVVFAPAGFGVREFVFDSVMSSYMDANSAFVLALVSRVIHIVGDAVAAGVALGLSLFGAILRKHK